MLTIINKVVWAVAIGMIFFCGIYYTIRLKFPQISGKNFKRAFQKTKKGTITPFKIVTMTLAGRIGVGSLAGIAIAIYYGGPGSIFWIWVSSFLTASLSFVESFLGVFYKEKDGIHYKGGPSYYMDKGLHQKKLAKCYALLILLSYFIGFLTIQANTIAISFSNIFNLSKWLIGIFLVLITILLISKGLESITNVCAKMVPFMGGFYFLIGLWILIKHHAMLPSIISTIITDAFHPRQMGIGILSSFMIGLQRGIFSNEAGLGTGAIASGALEDDNAIGQGMLQVLGVYVTSFVICTMTALIILTSNYTMLNLQDINGIELIQYAFTYHLGNFGTYFLFIIIFLFAFSTIITVYYYGESNLKYVLPNAKKSLIYLKWLMLGLILYGCLAKANILWNLVDLFVAFLAIINIFSIYQLRSVVEKEVLKKHDRKQMG